MLMAMARIYWERENYAMVEKLFRQSAEFCSEHETWKLNVAHVFFMQESKWKEAIRYYDPIIQKSCAGGAGDQQQQAPGPQQPSAQPGLLSVPAIVLANLCVAYIMTSQNEAAEELMRKIEKEEEQERLALPSQNNHTHHASPPHHLCLVNLVIGTLYCAKGNFEFGIARVIKSMEPLDQKLNPDTWHYAKRCFLALAEHMAKHLVTFKDASLHEILEFLDAVELQGNKLKAHPPLSHLTARQGGGAAPRLDEGERRSDATISYEARQVKCLFIKLME